MGLIKKVKYWIAEKPEKRISKLQKAIDLLNKALDLITVNEKYYLDEAAEELEEASKYGGYFASQCMKNKEESDRNANYFTSMRPFVLNELAWIERLKEREIKALQDRALTKQKTTRPFCFLF